MIGHIKRGFNGNATNRIEMYPYIFVGQTSDWSNTHTVTLPQKVPITVSSPTQTPTVPEFPVLIILPFIVSMLAVAVYFKHRRTNHE